MSTFEIELPPHLAGFIREQIAAGTYGSASEAIADAVRRLSEDYQTKTQALREALAPGVAEADAGIFFKGDMDDIIAEARGAAPRRK